MEHTQKVFMLLYRTQEGYLLAHNGHGFICAQDLETAKQNWMVDYDRYHAAGMTWSASATMHYLSFQPAIVQLACDDSLREILTMMLKTIRSHCGQAQGVEVKTEHEALVRDAIVFEPRLMTKAFEHATPFYQEDNTVPNHG